MQSITVREAGVAVNQACDVQIWTASPADFDDAQWRELGVLLDSTERARSQQFKQPADRRAYVLAHALRRIALAQALQVAPAALSFSSDHRGKPLLRVPHNSGIFFSHAHSRALVACAVTRIGPVGIDVACAQDGSADLDLLAGLVDLPDARRREAEIGADPAQQFLFYWSALEAFWKAVGCGLSSANPPVRCQKNRQGRFEILLEASGPSSPQARVIALQSPAACSMALALTCTSERTIEMDVKVNYKHLGVALWPGQESDA